MLVVQKITINLLYFFTLERTLDSIYSMFFLLFQETRTPLPAPDVSEVHEQMREMGVLVGKGGLYGSVSTHVQILLFETLNQLCYFTYQYITCMA